VRVRVCVSVCVHMHACMCLCLCTQIYIALIPSQSATVAQHTPIVAQNSDQWAAAPFVAELCVHVGAVREQRRRHRRVPFHCGKKERRDPATDRARPHTEAQAVGACKWRGAYAVRVCLCACMGVCLCVGLCAKSTQIRIATRSRSIHVHTHRWLDSWIDTAKMA
jgi:hypothetical protein